MPRGVASAKQLALMEKVLNVYCEKYRVNYRVRREDVAPLALELFNLGFRDEETLLAELISRRL